MNEVDQSQAQLSDGQMLEKKARDRGFNDDEVDSWKGEMTDNLVKRGFSPQEIKDFWGEKEPNMAPVNQMAKQNVAALKTSADGQPKQKREPIDVSPKPVEAKDVWDAMAAAYGNSILQLAKNGQESPIQMPQDPSVKMTLANAGASFLSDSPFYFLGGVGGGPVGAFALPAALRATYMDGIRNNEFKDAGDFAKRITNIGWETGKGAIQGFVQEATAGSMQVANAFGGPITKALTTLPFRIAAEDIAMTTVSSALEGELPKPRDFINNGVAIGGLHAVGFGLNKVGYVSGKLMNVFSNTGAMPRDVVTMADQDAYIKQQLLSENPNLPREATPTEKELPKETSSEAKAAETKDAATKAGEEIMSRIAPEEKVDKGLKEKGMDVKNALYKWWIDTNDYTRAIGNVMKEQGLNELPAEKNAHKLMNLFPAHIDKVQMAMHNGTLDFATKTINGESFDNIINDYKSEFPDDPKQVELKKYEIARQSLDLADRGISKIGSRENDKIFVEANKDKYQKYLDRKVQWENRNLQYVKDSGLISEDQMKRIVDANPNHVPLHVVQEIDELTGRSGGNGKILKRITGSDRMLIDPDVSRLKNLDMMVRLAEENHAIRTFFQQEMALPEEKRSIRLVNPDMKAVRLSSEEVNEALKKQGIDVDADSITAFRPRENILSDGHRDFYDNGKRVVFEGHPDVIDALNRLKGDNTSLNVWAQYILRPATVALRALTVNNPFFGLRHIEKNNQVAATYSQTGFIPYQGWAKQGIGGMKEAFEKISSWRKPEDAIASLKQIGEIVDLHNHLMKNDPDFQKFVANGGAVGAVIPLDRGYLDGEIYKLSKPTNAFSKLWNGTKTVATFTHAAISINDNLIRYEEFKGLKEQGKSDLEAAYGARQILPDYQKAALQKSALHTIKAFLKVHMISVDRMGQELADPEKRYGFLLKNLTWVMLPQLLLNAANAGDEELDDVSEHDKYVSYVTRVNNWRPANSLAEAMSKKSAYPSSVRQKEDGSYEVNDGKVWRIPKPFAPGVVFGSAPNAILDAWKKQSPEPFAKYLGEISRQIVVSPIPDLPTPILEHLNNRNFWHDTPLVRQSMQNKLPWEQYDQNTSETAKLIGRALSYVPYIRDFGPSDAHLSSPAVVDNYLHSFGTLGNYLVDLTDKSLRASGIAPPDPGRIRDLETKPFIREFMIRTGPGSHPQSIEDFMDRYRQADQVKNTIKDLLKKGDVQGAVATQDRYSENMMRLQGVDKAIINAQKTITNIDLDPKMPENEKRQAEQTLYYQMVSWAKEGNRLMDEFEKKAKNKKVGNN